jgi:hypothetical protein
MTDRGFYLAMVVADLGARDARDRLWRLRAFRSSLTSNRRIQQHQSRSIGGQSPSRLKSGPRVSSAGGLIAELVDGPVARSE